MHFSIITLFFLQPYIFALRAFKNFSDNSRNREKPVSSTDAVSFLIWVNIYVYWLLYLARREDDGAISLIAEATQRPYFAEFFALFSAMFFILQLILPSLIVARKGYVEAVINTSIRCSAISDTITIFIILLSIYLTKSGLGEIGHNGDPVDLRWIWAFVHAPAFISLFLSLRSMHSRNQIRIPPIFGWLLITLPLTAWFIIDSGTLHSLIVTLAQIYYDSPDQFKENFWELLKYAASLYTF